jgi:spore coat protein JB
MDNKRKQMLKTIMAWEFTALEFNLYLDTHPDDCNALAEHNAASEAFMALKKEYEALYGPLTNFGTTPSPRSWRWIDDPWPWEITF